MGQHTAEVPARCGGAWRLTVELQPKGKPFAWAASHATGPQRRTGECNELDFAIHDAEEAMRGLDVPDTPTCCPNRELGPASQPNQGNPPKGHDDPPQALIE